MGIRASTSSSSSGGVVVPQTNGFRLTLAPGNPVYAPQPVTPNSTDTSGDTVTLPAGHGLVTGTIVTPAATAGGLTTGTRYYINVSTNTVSFHTTLANALAGTSKVDLTATIGQIVPSGISNTTLYFSPYCGAAIALYSGSAWSMLTSAEVSLALGTLSSGVNYDVFAYNNAGTLTLELLAWSSDTARATALVRQDGVWSKTGALTRRYVGTIRTDSTTTTIDDAGGIASQVGAKRFVWNVDNRVLRMCSVWDSTSVWQYSTTTWRQGDGAAGNKVEFVIGLSLDAVKATLISLVTPSSSVDTGALIGINLDSITALPHFVGRIESNQQQGNLHALVMAYFQPPIGYHYMAWMEKALVGSPRFGSFEGVGLDGWAGLTGTTVC